jgi:hypothetical protein
VSRAVLGVMSQRRMPELVQRRSAGGCGEQRRALLVAEPGMPRSSRSAAGRDARAFRSVTNTGPDVRAPFSSRGRSWAVLVCQTMMSIAPLSWRTVRTPVPGAFRPWRSSSTVLPVTVYGRLEKAAELLS